MSRTTSVTAEYSMFDVTAAPDSRFSMPGIMDFSDFAELLDESQTLPKWMTLEQDGSDLDGSFCFLPDDIASVFTGVWSAAISDANGRLTTPLTLTVQFSKPHTMPGITLLFSEDTGDWCGDLTITWYDKDGTVMAQQDFQPDSGNYFCAGQVEDFYRLQITFRTTNKPYHYLKLSGIRYGVSMELTGKQLVSCSVLEEVNPTSAELSVNTLQLQFRPDSGAFDLLDLTGAYVLFQQRQRVRVYGIIQDKRLHMGTFYLDEPTATDNLVTLDCMDLVGTLDDTDYLGGYWPDGIAAKSLLADIMQSAGLDAEDYTLEDTLQDVTVYGYLAIQSHRSALQQLAFTLGAVVSCARSEQIQIRRADTNVKTVPIGRKVIGHEQTLDPLVTGVEVYVHHYALQENESELFRETRQAGEYLIQFSSPAAELSASGAEILKSGINYARIAVQTEREVTLTGRTYEDTQTLSGSVYRENLPANGKENVKTITECTLDADAQALAQRIYDDAQNRMEDSGQVILSDEKAGDCLAVQTAGRKTLIGMAEQVDIDLAGGFLAKVVVRGAAADI